MAYRVHYRVSLRASVDFDAPDQVTASDAARVWLRRTYGLELMSVEILRTEDREDLP